MLGEAVHRQRGEFTGPGIDVGQVLAGVGERTPLPEPQFVLGILFIVAVYFLPRGIAGGLRSRS